MVDYVITEQEEIRMIIIDENSTTFKHTCENNPNEICYACMLESELNEQDKNNNRPDLTKGKR